MEEEIIEEEEKHLPCAGVCWIIFFKIGRRALELAVSRSCLDSVKTKQNKTKQNKTKQNKTKQNKTKQNISIWILVSGAPAVHINWYCMEYHKCGGIS